MKKLFTLLGIGLLVQRAYLAVARCPCAAPVAWEAPADQGYTETTHQHRLTAAWRVRASVRWARSGAW